MTASTSRSGTATVARAFLIADIRGYTTFTRTHGDEAAGHLAGTFASLARLAVAARGGEVLELRGDEVLAVFEDPAQAVRAAVELQAICAEDAGESPGFGFPVGVGLDFGDVVPVEDGFRGAAINLAARLCSKAQAGEVLATRNLVELAGEIGIAVVHDRPPVEVKGYPDPVPLVALSLDAEVAGADADDVEPGPLPVELDSYIPHIGRETQLNWLLGTWRQARRGRGRIVAVSGPAGIGKTRLAAALAARSGAARVVYGGAGGAGAATTLAAIHAAWHAEQPTVVVLDDLLLYPGGVNELAQAADAIERCPSLVVVLAQEPESHPALAALLARIDERGDGHRVLGPLTDAEVRDVVALYARGELADAPLESMARTSAGNPARLHELASEWARDESRRRLAAAAEWMADSRSKQSSGIDFANNLIALRLGRMFAAHTDLTVDACPYKGLAPFDLSDAPYFYGRERLVGDLAARSVGAGLLAVVGPSGSGKSSVVMAGLLPSLAGGLLPGSDRWLQAMMRPGAHPLEELDSVLPRDSAERVVLVVDQFEESFTTCADERERAAFIARLVDLAGDPDRAVVVVTVRADYTGHCAPYAEFAQLVTDNLVLVGPMSSDELRRVIELPARRVGLRVESSLVDTLVADVVDEPGALPMLSTALVELWQQRDEGWLRSETYEATGGVRGAVARLAEASYAALPESNRLVARSLLLRLVGEGEGEAAVRRRAPMAEFDEDPSVLDVLTRLTEDRLLIRDDSQIEIAHEALIREWPRLRGWLEEDATGRQLRVQVTGAAKNWADRSEDDADLYRGARLTATLDWASTHWAELNALERDFLERSRQASMRAAEKQRRTNRRLRGLLVGTAVFLVVALTAGVLAVVQRGHARTAQRDAEAQALRSDAERLGALALAEKVPDKALLEAVAGLQLENRAQTRSDLLSVLERTSSLVHVTYPAAGSNDGVAVSPDGRTMAVGTSTGVVRFYDAMTSTPLGQPADIDGEAVLHQAFTFAPDGTLVVGSHSSNDAHLWLISSATHQVIRRLTWHTNTYVYPQVSPNSRQLAVLFSRYTGANAPPTSWVKTYAFPSLRPQRTIHYPAGEGGNFEEISYLDNHHLVASQQYPVDQVGGFRASGTHHTLRIDVATGQVRLMLHQGGVLDVSPDGHTLALGTNDSGVESIGRAIVVDADTGASRELQGAAGMHAVLSLRFSPDGTRLLVGGQDGSLRLLDVATGALVTSLDGAAGPISDVRFSPDGSSIFSAGADGSLMTWDVAGRQRLGQTLQWGPASFACDSPVCFAVDPTGTRMALPESTFARVRLFDLHDFTAGKAFANDDGDITDTVAFSPDGSLMATGGSAGRVTLWRSSDLKKVGHLHLQTPGQTLLAFSPTQNLLATLHIGSPKFSVAQLWDVDTRKLVRTWRLPWGVVDLVFSPDGKQLVTIAGQSTDSLQIHDTATGRALPTPKLNQSANAVAFARDTGLLAVALYDGTVLFWDIGQHRSPAPPLHVSSTYSLGLALSADGSLLANDVLDGDETLWDLRSRSQIGDPLPSPPGQVGTPQFLPNGDLVQMYNGNAVKWPMSPQRWADFACQVAGRDMTPAEWHDLLPNRPYQHVCP